MTCKHCNGRVMVFDDEASCIACGRSPQEVRVLRGEEPREPAPLTPGQLRWGRRKQATA